VGLRGHVGDGDGSSSGEDVTSGRTDGRESGREGRERARDVIIFQILSVPFLPLSGKNFDSYTLPTDTNLLPPSLPFFFFKKKKKERSTKTITFGPVLECYLAYFVVASKNMLSKSHWRVTQWHAYYHCSKKRSSNDRTSHRDVKSKQLSIRPFVVGFSFNNSDSEKPQHWLRREKRSLAIRCSFFSSMLASEAASSMYVS